MRKYRPLQLYTTVLSIQSSITSDIRGHNICYPIKFDGSLYSLPAMPGAPFYTDGHLTCMYEQKDSLRNDTRATMHDKDHW